MTIIVYDEWVPCTVIARLAELEEYKTFCCGEKIMVLRGPVHEDAVLRVMAYAGKPAPPPWQNAAPYLKRKKGRS